MNWLVTGLFSEAVTWTCYQCELVRRIIGTRKSIRTTLAQRRVCYRHLQGTQCWHAKLQFITTYVT